uniref:Uncharacterized protein n=1 Tax=Cyprinus carpio carpio TaxID=630221 RepID=A0A9J8DJL5_CYPCA
MQILSQELQTLLGKEAIEHVPFSGRESGYYSRYFLVPKKGGGVRPILDLRGLNRTIRALKFKMLTVKTVVSQIRNSLLYKSPGGSALTQSEQDSEADFSLGPGQAPVTQGSLHSGVFECGSGFTVQTDTTDRGMETPPRGSETDLGKILQSRGGPLRLPSDSAMSPLLLSESPSPPGSGCDGAHMAQNAPVCVSSSFSAPGSPSQSSPTRVLPLADSATLAEQSMVLGDNISPRRLAMGDSGEEGPSVSGRGHDIPSQSRPVESSCLAPEGYQLRNTGLSPGVIDTILSARASSTRQSYASKSGVFDRWCVVHNVDPVNCHIALVLDFMQEKLSTGTCPATLKVYVAALSACHALIDGMPLGRHPLLSRFLPARHLVPLSQGTRLQLSNRERYINKQLEIKECG